MYLYIVLDGYMRILDAHYQYMRSINPDLFACGCRTCISLDIVHFYKDSANHPASPHGRLAKNHILDPHWWGWELTQFAHQKRCDCSTACRLYFFIVLKLLSSSVYTSFSILLNFRRSSRVQVCASNWHCNICLVVSETCAHSHVVPNFNIVGCSDRNALYFKIVYDESDTSIFVMRMFCYDSFQEF